MIKPLLKKQLMEVFAWIYRNNKTGKNRTVPQIIGFCLLYFGIFSLVGVSFYYMASSICKPMYSVGYGWLYWTIMLLLSVALGVFGSVFNTFASLYIAKDNDLLLSLPITPIKIISVRLVGVYLMGLMYEMFVFIPAVIALFVSGYALDSILSTVMSILSFIPISLFILSLTCILGFVVAFISMRLKNKSIMTVIFSLGFIAIYYYVYGNAYKVIGKLIKNPAKYGDSIRKSLFLFYHYGLGCTGDFKAAAISVGITVVITVIVAFILVKSFFKIATFNKGETKKAYKSDAIKSRSIASALLSKEFKRFLSSPTYMLNCGLGLIITTVLAIMAIVYCGRIRGVLLTQFAPFKDYFTLVATALVCMTAAVNDFSAPSVSLEGKNIWIAQSLPVEAAEVLKAKLKMHLRLGFIPTVFSVVAVNIVVKSSWYLFLLSVAAVILFSVFTALLGLFSNLKSPNLNWTSEIVPIKQSASVMISLFGGWGLVVILSAGYFFIRKFVPPFVYLSAIAVAFAVVSGILYKWIITKGAKIFATL